MKGQIGEDISSIEIGLIDRDIPDDGKEVRVVVHKVPTVVIAMEGSIYVQMKADGKEYRFHFIAIHGKIGLMRTIFNPTENPSPNKGITEYVIPATDIFAVEKS